MKIFDAIIIGAGPAGCTCATWLKQLGFSPALVERHSQCGGLQFQDMHMNSWIPSSYPSRGKEIAAVMHQNVTSMGIDLHLETTALSANKIDNGFRVKIQKQNNEQSLLSKYLVLAGGVLPKTGGLSEKKDIFIGATPRLAATDFNGKSVAILGGGDTAFENYPLSKDRGAKSVTIFARTIRARQQMVEKVPEKNVRVGSFECDQEKNIVNGEHFDAILVMFGYEASEKSLLGLKPQMKPDGYILTDQTCQTSLKDVYAIGEIANRAHPCCLTAMADGVVTAKALQKLIEARPSGHV